MRIAPRNRVLFVLILIAIAACAFVGFVSIAPNRLVSGQPLALAPLADMPDAVLPGLMAVSLLALSFVEAAKAAQLAALGIASVLLLLLFFEAGHLAVVLTDGARPATRVGLGPAFWVALFCLAMAVLDALQRFDAGPALRMFVLL